MFSKKPDDNFFGKSVLDSLESNICLLDEKGNIEFANASWFDFAKDNKAEIGKISEGCNYLEVCDNARGDDKELAKQAAAGIRSVIAGKEDKFELEYPCHSPSVERWFLARVTPYRDLVNTSMRKVVVFHEDITKIKQEEKLTQSRLNIMEFSYTNTLEAVLQKTIDEVCKITGSKIGFYHFVSKDEKTLTLKAWSTDTIEKYCPLGDQNGMEYKVDEAGVWVDCVRKRRPVIHNDYSSLKHRQGLPQKHAQITRELVVPIMRQGKIVAILGVANKPHNYTDKDVNITTNLSDVAWEVAERKFLDEHLELQAQMLDTAPGFVMVFDFNGNICFTNQRAVDLYGFTKEEFMNMKLHDIITPEAIEKIPLRMEEVDKKGEAHFEVENFRKDGTTFPLDVYVKKIEWYGKQAIFSIGTDITKRKQAEKKLQETYKEIEVKQRQIDQELKKAKKIYERTLLGSFSKAGSPEDISLEAHYCPAKQIGGDFYNFIRRENKLIIYLSDVTGHGLEAAIISTFVKETIENYADLETGELTPEKILTHVYKHYVNNDFPEDYFVCLCIAVLHLDTYELSYSTVGMQFPPIMKLADGSCINLQSEGPPISSVIGLELMDFRADSVTLIPGSIVLFYTDGIAEQMNEDNRPYEKRLKNTFYSQQSKFPPEIIKQVINTDFVDFNGSLQGDDDITYVILQINPPERKQYY